MKTFIIASSEYEANHPDMFVMKEDGTYYGVSEYSYAKFHKYPKNVDFWKNADGSDAGRNFFVEEVELSQEQVESFEKLTRRYYEIESQTPVFGESYPIRSEFKSKKAYEKAFEEHRQKYLAWVKENNVWALRQEKDDVWVKRVKLFLSFSENVYRFLRDNDNIKYL